MSDYRRYYVPGGTYFFTVVTQARRPLFNNPFARRSLREAFAAIRAQFPFTIVALVLLPNHLHTVRTLPLNDDRYSTRWRRIKETFSRKFLSAEGAEVNRSRSRLRRGESGVCKRRFGGP